MKEFIFLVIIVLCSFSEVKEVSKLISNESTSTILILLVAELGLWLVAFAQNIFVFMLVFEDCKKTLSSEGGFYAFCF